MSLGLVLAGWMLTGVVDPTGPSPETRALAFLAVEVPGWTRDHRCVSCHNNGDAARALLDARRRGLPSPNAALTDTIRWLGRPEEWDHNGGEGPFSDKILARIQFASALRAAVDAGAIRDRAPLAEAARRLAADQSEEGSWPIDDGGRSIGSPASYGRPLATLIARDTLRATDADRFRDAVIKADRWLLARPVASVVDAAVALCATTGHSDAAAVALRDRALARLREGRSDDGGWGPFVTVSPEVFDTALVVLALRSLTPTEEIRGWINGARAFLIARQLDDGSWPETTRPSGAESYAQRLSTSGWATLALLATSTSVDDERNGDRLRR